jgi:hypothetical protein
MTEVLNFEHLTKTNKDRYNLIEVQDLYNQTEKIQSRQSIYLESALSTPPRQDFVAA